MSELYFTDYVYGYVFEYFTTILCFDKLDLHNLQESYNLIITFFNRLSFIISYIRCNNFKNFINNRIVDTKYSVDIKISILQTRRYTIFVIDAYHNKIDGMLLFNIIEYWSKTYTNINKKIGLLSTNIDYNYIGNFHINKSIIASLKDDKYKFSDYVIATTIWATYIFHKTNKRIFGHVISCRMSDNKYSIGNFITIINVKICDSFLNSCLLLNNTIESVKQQSTCNFRFANDINCIKNYIECDVVFDSWLSFKHINFNGKNNLGVYMNNLLNEKYIDLYNKLIIIGHHDNFYYLTHKIADCRNDSFVKFIKEFIQK